jgi:hypothetical protein
MSRTAGMRRSSAIADVPGVALSRVGSAYKRLTALGFPRRFPIVQFPNLPLIVAFLAGEAALGLHGEAHFYARSVAYLGMTVWAYEELVDGVNWFRHLLGFTYAVILITRVAHALQ